MTKSVACTLPALELRQRASEIRGGLAQRVTATRELEDGIAFRLALTEETVAEAQAFVAFERRCCEFADFSLHRDEANGLLWIEIRGPKGTKAFFEQLV